MGVTGSMGNPPVIIFNPMGVLRGDYVLFQVCTPGDNIPSYDVLPVITSRPMGVPRW